VDGKVLRNEVNNGTDDIISSTYLYTSDSFDIKQVVRDELKEDIPLLIKPAAEPLQSYPSSQYSTGLSQLQRHIQSTKLYTEEIQVISKSQGVFIKQF